MYLIQAILIDDTGRHTIETVTENLKSDDYTTALELLMRRHRNSTDYKYIVMKIETQEIILRTTQNKFAW